MGFLDYIKETLANFVSENDLYKKSLSEFISNLGDSFATEIEWEPLASGGSSFVTHDLVLTQNGNYEFKISKYFKFFSLFFTFFIGSIFSVMIFIIFLGSFDYSILFGLIVPLIFILIGVYIYRSFTNPIVFDKQSGYFYKGMPKINYGIIDTSDKKLIPLNLIYSIQILREKVSSKNSSFFSYELNLVLNDKRRINIVDYGNLESIRNNAKILGEYLGVPIWDAGEFKIF